MAHVPVERTAHRLLPDPRRVLAKPYLPGDERSAEGLGRIRQLAERIVAIPEGEVAGMLAALLASFSPRHDAFEATLDDHFARIAPHIHGAGALSPDRRRLLGAYFTHEYAVEGAALFNPSIVWAPDQHDVPAGQRRFVMSLRAVGEGHISSIEFRSGLIDDAGSVALDEPQGKVGRGRRTAPSFYSKRLFHAKLAELGASNPIAGAVLQRLGDKFTLAELNASAALLEHDKSLAAMSFETMKIIHVLAASSYVTTFEAGTALDERVLFPAGPNETHGMEDARFVLFTDDDGSVRYHATYTAYDGFAILPQLIDTEDFVTFSVSTLRGAAAQNKGMALFPRRIDGEYVMLSRRDRENLYVARSNDVHAWETVTHIYGPSHPWELLQIGNCGSPLETEAGWLVLTHGVGAMRRYVLGALLLDLDDPRRVVGHLTQPLLIPDETEREGYVPNVIYTCGAIIHGDHLILPYGFSDCGIRIARLSLPALLAALLKGGPPPVVAT